MPSELPAILNPYDQRSPASAVRDVAELLGKDRLRARITAGAQAGASRTVTVQAVDRRGQAVKTRCLVRVHVATAEDGDPDGVQTAAWLSGSVRATFVINQEWQVVTETDGSAQLDLSLAGGGTRWIDACVSGDYQSSGPVVWMP